MGVDATFGTANSGDTQLFTFNWTTDTGQPACSKLFVIKTVTGNVVTSRMLARGFSTGCSSITATGTVERVIEYLY
jgi:hypothetical protein